MRMRVALADGPCGGERHDLTEAVAAHGGRRDTERAQQAQEPEAVRADGGLRPLGGGQLVRRALLLVGGELRAREDHVVQLVAGEREAGRRVPRGAHLFERDRDLATHLDVLAALPREEQRNTAVVDTQAEGHSPRAVTRHALVGQLGRLPQLLHQLGLALGHHGHARAVLRSGGVERQLRRLRQEHEHARVGAGLHLTRERTALGRHVGRAATGHHHQLADIGPRAVLPRARARVLLEGDVEVCSRRSRTS
jgi:hypothetical protein